MKLASNSRLLFIGDSITDCGRARPVGEGSSANLGAGYVTFVDALLGVVYPQLQLRILNTGIGGDTVRHLKARWQSDVIDLKPDWLSIMIGINDVWRQFDRPRMGEIHVLPEEYESTLRDLIERTRPMLKGLVLMTPYYIEPNRDDAMRKRMDQYSAIVRKLAGKYNAVLADTQAAFDKVLAHNYPGNIAGDRVHPNQTGHMVIARAFLDAMGFEW